MKMTKTLLILLLAGAVLRLLHGFATWENNPLTQHLNGDALYYDQWSEKIVSGEYDQELPFYLPPLYPHLLAGVRLVTGSPLPFMLLLQGVLGLLSLFLIYQITRSLFDDRAALIAGILYLFYGPILFYETKLLATTLAIFLGLLSVVLLNQTLRKPTPWLAIATGLTIGWLCEARPNFLIFAVLAIPLVKLVGKAPFTARLKTAAFLGVGILIPLAVSLTLNLSAGEGILVSGNGGINLYFGNHENASGVNNAPTRDFSSIFDQQAAAKRLAEEETRRPMSQSEISAFWRGKAVDQITSDWGGWIAQVLHKLKLFFSSFEPGVLYIPAVESHLSPVLGLLCLPAGLLLLLGLGGLGLAIFNRTRGLSPLLIFLAANLATIVLFFMASRFRLPFIAGLLPFAGYFVLRCLVDLKTKRLSFPLWTVSMLISLTGISFFTFDRDIRKGQSARATVTLSRAFLRAGDLDGARVEARKALKITRTPAIYFQLGEIEEAAGNRDGAVENYQLASTMDPTYLEPLGNLAAIYEREERWFHAMDTRRKMIEIIPHRFEGHYNLGMTLLDAGKPEEAAVALAEALAIGINNPGVLEALGKAFIRVEKPEMAIKAYIKAIQRDPARAAELEEKIQDLESSVNGS